MRRPPQGLLIDAVFEDGLDREHRADAESEGALGVAPRPRAFVFG